MVSEGDMTPIQRRRFRYFRQMRIFITNLTNICERLRFKERGVRRYFLKRDMHELAIPPFAYIPLFNSTEPFQTILKTLPKECHAFNTKARCPALMIFEVQEHPNRADIASFLGYELENYDETVLFQKDCELRLNFAGASETKEEIEEETAPLNPTAIQHEQLESPFQESNEDDESRSCWVAEGSGMERLHRLGLQLPGERRNSRDMHRSQSNRISAVASIHEVDVGVERLNSNNNDSYDHPISDPTVALEGVLGETFAGKINRIRGSSSYGQLPGWSLNGLIAKSNDDVRQEVFVMQLMTYYQRAFEEANIPVWMHSYKILSTSKTTGLIELIPNATSLDGLKKSQGYPGTLRAWYEQAFPEALDQALENYVASQAAYSIVAYLLAIKDRHNGNIMIDKDGHVIHIDFGFVFGLGKCSSYRPPLYSADIYIYI
jgi:hypothetical protein